MPFIALRFDTSAQDTDAWSDALLDAGALSVDVSDPFAGTEKESPIYGEPGSAPGESWATSRVVALLNEDADADTLINEAARAASLSLPAFETYPVADEDWVRNTQRQFGPIEIAPHFFIVPSWSQPPDPHALNLRLDPGLAFGTGSHPTTRLCLRWLRDTIAGGESVLDYGCGSGILAVAAAKLGASRVIGVDVDAQAIRASESNASANDVRATFVDADSLAQGTFDIVVANILANPLIVLAPALASRVAKRGAIALSGILEAQADSVIAAYAPWFKLAAQRVDEGWVLLTGAMRS